MYMHSQLQSMHTHGHVRSSTLRLLCLCLVRVLQLYQEFGATYKHWFEFLLPRSNQKLVTGHHPSSRSFKIVAECPVIGTCPDNAFAEATPLHSCMPTCADACTKGTFRNDQQMECNHSLIRG